MKGFSGRRIIKLVLLASFIGCLGLYITAGPAFAATTQTAWGSNFDNNQCDSHNMDQNCGDEFFNHPSSNVSFTCDSFDQNGVCNHYKISFSGSRPSNCDSWDAQNHVCNHFTLNFLK